MLKMGDMGKDVVELQDWLISIGMLDSKERYYSIKTKNAVTKLQTMLDYEPTGKYDKQLKVAYNIAKDKNSYSLQLKAITKTTKTGETESTGNATEQSRFDESVVRQTQDFPCYIVNLLTNDKFGAGTIYIPHIPEEFTYSKGNTYEEQTTKGRSEPFQGYTGSTALTVSCNVTISADYVPNRDIDAVLNKLEALAYPRYSNMVVPPKIFFRCGTFSVEGVLNDISITRRLPIINGKYSIAEVSFNITETNASSISAIVVQDSKYRAMR